jgi:uncharacterized membrane protein YozB (DUF420 family)
VQVFAVTIPQEGFFGTGAPFAADVNLVIQVAMAVALVAGALLARNKRYRAHAITQTTVLLLNLVMIVTVMWPSTRGQVMAAFPDVFGKWYFAAPSIHAMLGIAAELLGLYVALSAGTRLVPERFRFRNWKSWMQTELVLWWITLVTGIGTYYVWYVRG